MLALAPEVHGSTPATPDATSRLPSRAPQPGGRWGERLAAAGNLDGDGQPDFFVGDPQADLGTIPTPDWSMRWTERPTRFSTPSSRRSHKPGPCSASTS